MEDVAQDIAAAHSDYLNCTVVKGQDVLEREGLDLLAAVGQGAGAVSPPRLVLLEYDGCSSGMKEEPKSSSSSSSSPSSSAAPLVLVGKGITFDTGGLNLKPTGAIENMHMDMCGAAAVLAAINGIARLKLPLKVIAAVALAENAIGPNAVRPLEIVGSKKGVSVEVFLNLIFEDGGELIVFCTLSLFPLPPLPD